jgi:phosphoribosylformylglycinamidine synthase
MRVLKDVLDAIAAHARQASPQECCGLLIGDDGRITEAVATQNAAADPLRRYEISPVEDRMTAPKTLTCPASSMSPNSMLNQLKRFSARKCTPWVAAATAWLERNVQQVNAVNVFPVPDGDTGTNMFLTMRFALEEAAQAQSAHAGEVAIGRMFSGQIRRGQELTVVGMPGTNRVQSVGLMVGADRIATEVVTAGNIAAVVGLKDAIAGATVTSDPDMEPFEILTSESQERMLAIVRPDDVDHVLSVCARWGVLATPIAQVIEGGSLTVRSRGEVVAELPARSLADEGPTYRRPMRRPEWLEDLRARDPAALEPPKDCGEALLELLASPNVCDKSWVYEQYDQIVRHNTISGPGGDAAVIRIEGNAGALAVATDGSGRFGALDPRAGAMHAVCEAARNVACVGARPIAITNCLNFGNPEQPEVMWQFAEAVAGIGEACRALGTPVTGGNVSFYNQTGDAQIHPTPIIGMVGLLGDADHRLGIAWRDGHALILLGETRAELGGSEWAWVAHGHLGGAPPTVDLDAERALVGLLATLAERGLVASAHDCSEGGLGVALAECAIAGGVGAQVEPDRALTPHAWLFSESGARAVVATADAIVVLDAARDAGVSARVVGRARGDRLQIAGLVDLEVSGLAQAFRGALPSLMG